MDFFEALSHHGVLDQKHGIRNYQYPNGSLTPLGRIHYGVGPPRSDAWGTSDAIDNIISSYSDRKVSELPFSDKAKEFIDSNSEVTVKDKPKKQQEKVEETPPEESRTKTREEEMKEYISNRNTEKTYEKLKKEEEDSSLQDMRDYITRRNTEKTYNQLKKEEAGPSSAEQAKKALDEASKIVEKFRQDNVTYIKAHTSKAKLDLSKMSDQELRDQINRGNLEKQYNEMFAPTQVNVSSGRKTLAKILEYAGPLLATAGSAVTLATLINQYKKSK